MQMSASWIDVLAYLGMTGVVSHSHDLICIIILHECTDTASTQDRVDT